MKKDLTIILLLKERRNFTLRFIEYYLKNNLGYNLFISDGSKKKLDKKTLTKIGENPLITYKKFKEDLNYIVFYKKIISTLKIIKTKYVLFASNDDFLIYKTIEKCLKNLKKKNTLNGAGGTIYNFSIKENLKTGFFLHNIKKLYQKRNYEQKTPAKRIDYYFQSPQSTIHYVMKRKNLLKTYKTTISHFHNNIDLKEDLCDIINLTNGKIKIINSPILLHQASKNSEATKRPSLFLKHLKNKKFSNDLIKFINIISKKTKLSNHQILQNYYNKFMLPLLKNLTLEREPSFSTIIKTLNKKVKRRFYLDDRKIKSSKKDPISNEVKKIVHSVNNFLNEFS